MREAYSTFDVCANFEPLRGVFEPYVGVVIRPNNSINATGQGHKKSSVRQRFNCTLDNLSNLNVGHLGVFLRQNRLFEG
jgi:hypothetical protein